MAATILTSEILRKNISYNPESGELFRKGKPAGFIDKNRQGYVTIVVLGKRYLAHRIIWLHYYGEWPSVLIDHIDRNRSNNRINNLRAATHSINCQNRSKVKRKNPLPTGVYKTMGSSTFYSSIFFDGSSKYLGCFSSIEEAENIYISEKTKYHPGFVKNSSN